MRKLLEQKRTCFTFLRKEVYKVKRVIVIGCPGSGKSTFSVALHTKTGIPLYHLDMMYWNADKTTVEKSMFLECLSNVLKNEEWIIDGNYISTMELRMAECDTVIFLDYPLDVCLVGINERLGKPRKDIPWVETELDAEFIEFVKTYNSQTRPKVYALLDKYKKDKRIIVFNSREQADEFLSFYR